MIVYVSASQGIAGAKMELENVQRDLRQSDPAMAGKLDPVIRSLQEVIGSLRDTSRRLRPTTLDMLGLVTALRTLGDGKQTGKHGIDFYFHGVPNALDRELEIAIFRIAQEAVINAIRHAECEEVYLSLMGREDRRPLSIEDDGRGFVPDQAMPGSFGLVIMRERAMNAGGELRVESSPGKGTTVTAEFPTRKRVERRPGGD